MSFYVRKPSWPGIMLSVFLACLAGLACAPSANATFVTFLDWGRDFYVDLKLDQRGQRIAVIKSSKSPIENIHIRARSALKSGLSVEIGIKRIPVIFANEGSGTYSDLAPSSNAKATVKLFDRTVGRFEPDF
jgi:hypothetical protein